MKNFLSCLLIILIAGSAYLLTLKGVYGNPQVKDITNSFNQATKPFELSPERDRYLLVLSLVQNRSFALSTQLADAAFPDTGYYQGKQFIYFAPGISLLGVPLYILGSSFNLGQLFTFGVIPLFAIATLIFIFLICRDIMKLPIWSSLLACGIYAFASTSWSYAVTLYQHHVTAFFIFASFYGVWRYRQKSIMSIFWGLFVWTNYALAIFIDYPNAILMLPVMIYFFISAFSIHTTEDKQSITFRISFLLTSVFFIILMAIHGYYNYANFGSWKNVSGGLIGIKQIRDLHLENNPHATQKIAQMQKNKNIVHFFTEDYFVHGLYILFISNERGLFFYSPIFILGIFGVIAVCSALNIEAATLLSISIIDIFLYSSFGDPWGGWAFGPRYLIPTMAVLSIFIALWLSTTKHRIVSKLITFPLLIVSTAISLLGTLTTSSIPPKSEADAMNRMYTNLHVGYNFLYNLDFLKQGKSSSFLYNDFFANHIHLATYFLILSGTLAFIFIFILFVMPIFEKVRYEN